MINKNILITALIILVIIIIKVQYYFKTVEEFTTIYVPDNRTNGKYGFTCSKCISCGTDKYETTSCSNTQNRVCTPCRTTCPNAATVGQYISRGCPAGSTSDAVCSPCRNGNSCGANRYRKGTCGGTSNYTCHDMTYDCGNINNYNREPQFPMTASWRVGSSGDYEKCERSWFGGGGTYYNKHPGAI